jgi:hypothetical protein
MLSRRLSRALDTIDGGDLSGGDDLAGNLRTLIANGNGNRAIMRLASATGIVPEAVVVSARPKDERDTVIAVGNLPSNPGLKGASTSVRTIEFRDWIDMNSLVVARARRRAFSWSALANTAGNTTGNHLGTTIPDVLEHSSMFGLAGFTLHHYLLRQIAWLVERSLTTILREVGQDVPAVAQRPIELFGAHIDELHVTKRGEEIFTSMNFSVSNFPAELMNFEFNGDYRFGVNADRKMQVDLPRPVEPTQH